MKFKIIPNEQTPAIVSLLTAEEIIKNHYNLLIKFISFSIRQHLCAGLAANQVSCDGKRIMIPFFSIKNSPWEIIIAPEILQFNGKKQEMIEGCLTWLGKDIIAQRYPRIFVKYWNLKGEEKTENLSEFKAQVWQHEYNHLKGIKETIRDRKKI